MPLSNTNNGATFPGLTLKAWAQVTSAGALTKSFNVTSITKGGTGGYTGNFTSAMSGTTYLVKVQPTDATYTGIRGAQTTAAGTYAVVTIPASAGGDIAHYVEWWE